MAFVDFASWNVNGEVADCGATAVLEESTCHAAEVLKESTCVQQRCWKNSYRSGTSASYVNDDK